MKRISLIAIAAAVAVPAAAAEPTSYQCNLELRDMPKSAPRFADYRVPVVKVSRPAPVKLRNADHRMYRTRIRWAGKGPTNFAGHYSVNYWGCGTSCAVFVIVDLLTGEVTFNEQTISVGETPLAPRVQGRPDSRLLVVTGKPGELSSLPEAVRYYAWNGKTLKLVKAYPMKAICAADPPD